MKTRKIVMLTMLFTVLSMVVALAQGQRGGNASPEERATRMTDRLKTSLKLTDEQAVKVHAVYLQMSKDMAAARESGEDMRTSMQTIMAKQDTELQKILTPEQYKTYQDGRKQQTQTRFNGSGGGNPSN
jgi:Spy/CpxP family protein refolding chaperone